MTVQDILTIYFSISAFIMLGTALLFDGSTPKEIDNFYDWLFYGIFWILIFLKYMIKFFYKLFKT